MFAPFMQPVTFKRQGPYVRLLDVREDTANATTYTFTAVTVSPVGGCASTSDTYGTNPNLRSSTRAMITVTVHAEDAATVFSISSCTLGGVSGTERVDRGGATNAINTGIYTWTTDGLGAITSTDVVVTFSEAVTGCAICVLEISNIGVGFLQASNSVTSTGAANIFVNSSGQADRLDTNIVAIVASTCITGATSETFRITIADANNSYVSCLEPTILYEGQNAEFAYAVAWTYSRQTYNDAALGMHYMNIDWSGATGWDAAAITLA